MKKSMPLRIRSRFLAKTACLFALSSSAALGAAQGYENTGAAVYLRSADARLEKLASKIKPTPRQRREILSILREVEKGVADEIARGNARIREVLSETQQEIYDGLGDDTRASPPFIPAQRLQPLRDLGGKTRPAGGNGEMRGGRSGGGRGGLQGSQRGGGGGMMTDAPEGGSSQERPQGMAGQRGRCGDGLCDSTEKQLPDRCPQDCSTRP